MRRQLALFVMMLTLASACAGSDGGGKTVVRSQCASFPPAAAYRIDTYSDGSQRRYDDPSCEGVNDP